MNLRVRQSVGLLRHLFSARFTQFKGSISGFPVLIFEDPRFKSNSIGPAFGSKNWGVR